MLSSVGKSIEKEGKVCHTIDTQPFPLGPQQQQNACLNHHCKVASVHSHGSTAVLLEFWSSLASVGICSKSTFAD